MSANGKTRTRCPNFTATEVDTLVSLIGAYANIIECKRPDLVTAQQKDEAWAAITQQFNHMCGCNRNEKNVRVKYESIKKALRRKSLIKKEQLEFGYLEPSEQVQFNPAEERVKHIIANVSVDNGVSPDSEEEFSFLPIESNVKCMIEEIPEEESTSHENKNNEGLQMKEPAEPAEPRTTSYYNAEPEENYTKWMPTRVKITTNSPIQEKTAAPEIKKGKNSATAIYDRLAEAKLELVQLQIQLARNEDRRQEEAHRNNERRKFEEHQNNERRKEEEHKKRMKNFDKELEGK